MTDSSPSLFDFAIYVPSATSLERFPEVVAGLRQRHSKPAPIIELRARTGTSEVLVLIRFAFVHYSVALRQELEHCAELLGGRLTEAGKFPAEARERFYRDSLGACTARVVVGENVKEALAALADHAAHPPDQGRLRARFNSEDELAAACARSAIEGSIVLPGVHGLTPGSTLTLLMSAPEAPPLVVETRVVSEIAGEAGLRVRIEPSETLDSFVARRQALQRRGRRRGLGDGRRTHPRFDQLLEVTYDTAEEVRREWATNIGKGGLFVRTPTPPQQRSKVRLRITLPTRR